MRTHQDAHEVSDVQEHGCLLALSSVPIRAGLCTHAGDLLWSSTHAHLQGEDDALVKVPPLRNLISYWSEIVKGCFRTGACQGRVEYLLKGRNCLSTVAQPMSPVRV